MTDNSTSEITNSNLTRGSNAHSYHKPIESANELVKRFKHVFASSPNGASINYKLAHIELYDYALIAVRSRRRPPEEINEISERVSRLGEKRTLLAITIACDLSTHENSIELSQNEEDKWIDKFK